MVQQVAELHVERQQELAEIAVREMGKPMEQALGEVEFCGDIYGYYADRAEDFLKDEPIELLAGEGTAVIRRTSMGPLLGIMPWNFPYYQVARFAGSEPDRRQPDPAQAGAAVPRVGGGDPGDLRGGRLPRGRLPDDPRDQRADRRAVIPDPRVRGVSVTGSERAGSAVAELAGRHLKKVVLELGGSDPFILLGADDLDEVVEARGRRAARQHRAVLQRGEAVHRRRGSLRRLPRRSSPRR